MTNEEALKDLKRFVELKTTQTPAFLSAAVEALKKQIPKKPVDNHHCPNCELGLPVPGITSEWCSSCFNPFYCMDCGQAIDWSENV